MISQLWATNRLQFIRQADKLKDTLRSSFFTYRGRPESTAEHSWRLCLMAMTFEDQLKSLNWAKILKLCVIHDLGEALHADIPAVKKVDRMKKTPPERVDLLRFLD